MIVVMANILLKFVEITVRYLFVKFVLAVKCV